MTDLFTPLQAGDLALPNRILMAPLTAAAPKTATCPAS
jgi:NADH:flavin oxidoreductase / NADH oxidase family.